LASDCHTRLERRQRTALAALNRVKNLNAVVPCVRDTNAALTHANVYWVTKLSQSRSWPATRRKRTKARLGHNHTIIPFVGDEQMLPQLILAKTSRVVKLRLVRAVLAE